MLKKIQFKHKLLLLILIPLIGLSYFALTNIYQSYYSYKSATNLEQFSQLSSCIGNLVHETQKERSTTAVFLASNSDDLYDKLLQQRELTNSKDEAIRKFLADFNFSKLNTKLSDDIRKAIIELDNLANIRTQSSNREIQADQVIAYYTNLNALFYGALAEVSRISDNVQISNRITAYLNLLLGKGQAGIERTLLSKVFESNQFPKEELLIVFEKVSFQESYFNVFKLFAEKEHLNEYKNFLQSKTVLETMKMRKIAFDKAEEGNFGVDSKYWHEKMDEKINLLKKLEDRLSKELLTVSLSIIKAEKNTLWIYSIVLLFSFLVTIWISRYIIKEILELLGGDPTEVKHIAELIVDGNIEAELNADKEKKGLYGLMVNMYQTFYSKSKELEKSVDLAKEALADAEYNKNLGDAIIETAPNSIFTMGENQLILSVNKTAEKMYGYSTSELAGQNIKIITPPNSRQEQDSYIKSYLNTDVEKIDDKGRIGMGLRKDGTQFPAHVHVGVSEVDGKKIVVVAIRDLTEEVYQKNEIEKRTKEIERQNWLKTAQNNVFESTKGIHGINDLLGEVIKQISKELNALVGAFYLNESLVNSSSKVFKLYGSFAYHKRKGNSTSFSLGDGLIGQCALEKQQMVITNLPENYMEIISGIGRTNPKEIIITPVVHDGKVIGVFEVGLLNSISELEMAFLNNTSESLGIVINSVIEGLKTEELSREVNNQIKAINRSNAAIEFNLDGTIITVNAIYLDIMGYKLDELQGKHHSIFVSKEYKTSQEYVDFWNDLNTGKFIQGEFECVTKKGNSVWINGSYNPILGADGSPYKVLKIASDITKQKNLQFSLQKQTEKLEAQEEELRVSNEELTRQAEKLTASEEELRVQQEELASINAELEEKASQLEEQNHIGLEKNEALEQAKQALHLKAALLESSGKYKSEFLANMSHELRTPLNSILILSKLLSENKSKNLSDKQIEFSEVIHKSGADLLHLINEVLDLAKVESGKMELELEDLEIREIAGDFEKSFIAIAKDKGIKYKVEVSDNLPKSMVTDKMRLKQIIKNLISNAFKFTEKNGEVTISFSEVKLPLFITESTLLKSKHVIAIACQDTGIGIPKDKINTVFEAFKQADGSTQRKFGGTGLGLSITRELAKLLGGEIHLESVLEKGSTFTVYLPVEGPPLELSVEEMKEEIRERINAIGNNSSGLLSKKKDNIQSGKFLDIDDKEFVFGVKKTKLEPVIADDRDNLDVGDKVLLIVEDDLSFANVLLSLAQKKGFKTIVTDQGDKALEHVEVYLPSAIILDMKLPVMDGWTVLKKLKASKYAGIPVHIMSGIDKKKLGLDLGAVQYLVKPISTEELDITFQSISKHFSNQEIKTVLVIEDDANQNLAIGALLLKKEIKTIHANSGEKGLEMAKNQEFQMCILDLGLPDMEGINVLKELKDIKPNVPVIVFTGKELSSKQANEIEKFGDTSIVIKTAESYNRILEETELFIHMLNNPKDKTKVAIKDFEKEDVLKGKRILVVDDDMRNIFSLETVLELEGVECEVATNGVEAVEAFKSGKFFDAVLMDIMMPEMDGYQATQKIRAMGYTELPIIALTANAMKGDREKCLEAGVSDYMSKPVDIKQLLSLLRVWLYK